MMCDWTQWSSATNPVCTCGPSAADWIKQNQCVARNVEADALPEAKVEVKKAEVKMNATSQCGQFGCCSWMQGLGHGCKTAEGGCNMMCDWTQWSSATNPVCTCGPSAADWIKQNQCVACNVEADALPEAKVEVKKAEVKMNATSQCGQFGCCSWMQGLGHGCKTAE